MKHKISTLIFMLTLLLSFKASAEFTTTPIYGYDDVYAFHDGRAVVIQNGKYGAIDTSGNLVIPCTYKYMYSFSEGFARVETDNGKGFIDKSGNLIASGNWLLSYDFSDGMARITSESGQYGYIDTTGNLAIPCIYNGALDFSDGLAPTTMGGGTFDIIDKSGNTVFSCYYDNITAFSDGCARVNGGGKHAFINKNGDLITPFYDSADPFSDGMASIRKDNKDGFIDTTGKLVIPCIYSSFKDFSDGLAAVCKDKKWSCIDKEGNVVFDYTGYRSFTGFCNGYARVHNGENWGMINKTGTLVIPCIYNMIYDFDGDYTIAEQNGQHYIVSNSKVPEIGVILNGVRLTFNKPPRIIDGRTLVPLRTIFEAIKATVNWDGATQTVTVSKDNDVISFQIGNNTMTKNGQTITLDVAPQLIVDTTFVPLRAISEAFSFTVSWDGEKQEVTINN